MPFEHAGPPGISLRQLLPDARISGAQDIRVVSCVSDSRSCKAGDLFVALMGVEQDGHDFVAEALARGARSILAERELPTSPVPVCVVPDSRAAYGKLCHALAGNPSNCLKAIGVTGTNGKTTTTYLIASVLEAGGFLPGVMGTLGYFDGVDVETAPLTTPPAPVLATWLARMSAHGCTHAVVEVSSHALCLGRVAGMQFDAACFTNISHDHLDFHTTLDRYRAAKARLLDHLLPEGLSVFNADDALTASIGASAHGPGLSIGIDKAAELTATPVEQSLSHQVFLLSAEGETIPVEVPLIGRHNIYNCLIAAAVGMGYGLDLATIVRGLEAVRRIPGRLEMIQCGQPFGVYVDYAHTPQALERVLSTLRGLTSGKLHCVFGAGGDRDRSKRPHMGAAVDSLADYAVITNDNPRGEDPEQIAREIAAGFRGQSSVSIELDRAAAIHQALGRANTGDCVLIAGKGHEPYQICGTRKFQFDDREVARQLLHELFPSTGRIRAAA